MSIIINLLTGITKLRDAWPKINQNFTNIKTEVDSIILGSANAEVGQAHVSTAKSKTFAIIDDRFEEIETDLADNLTQLTSKASQTSLDTTNIAVTLKADKTYVDSFTSGSPKGTYATLVALQTAFPTGTAGVYVVTADGKLYSWIASAWTAGGVYQATGIAAGSVTQDKTSFFKTGKNLFNKATATIGLYVNQTTGALTVNAAYDTSDFIAVLPDTVYSRNDNTRVAYYDSGKTFISGILNGAITTPANCYFMKCSLHIEVIDTFQVELGALQTSYEPAFYMDLPAVIKNKTVIGTMLADGAVSIDKTNIATLGKNLFDKATVTDNFYVNDTTGLLAANAAYATSDYMPVLPDTAYTQSLGYYIVFYDVNKVYISGITKLVAIAPRTVTTPTNAMFARSSVSKASCSIDIFQFELGAIATGYEGYGYKFSKSYNPDEVINITLPPVIPVVVGHEVNIYFENILSITNLKNYQFDVTCIKGMQQNERWTYVPLVGDIGDISLTVSVYSNGILIKSASTIVRVCAVTKGSGQNLKVLVIGDSTTANGIMATELANLFNTDSMHITLIGTKGVTPAFHEGISGWTTAKFCTDPTSPFVFSSAFNFATYLSTNAITAPDICIINLGVNDEFVYIEDSDVIEVANDIIQMYDAMIMNMKLTNANMKFGICVTIPATVNQDAFGSSYGSDQTTWRYKRNNLMFVKMLIDYFKDKEASNIYLVPINCNVDMVNNINFAGATPINSRNPATIIRATNGVHLSSFGYYQVADSDYYWIKSMGS